MQQGVSDGARVRRGLTQLRVRRLVQVVRGDLAAGVQDAGLADRRRLVAVDRRPPALRRSLRVLLAPRAALRGQRRLEHDGTSLYRHTTRYMRGVRQRRHACAVVHGSDSGPALTVQHPDAPCHKQVTNLLIGCAAHHIEVVGAGTRHRLAWPRQQVRFLARI